MVCPSTKVGLVAPFVIEEKPVPRTRLRAHGRLYTRCGELEGVTSERCKERTALDCLSDLLILKSALGRLKDSHFTAGTFPSSPSFWQHLVDYACCQCYVPTPTPNYFKKFQILLTLCCSKSSLQPCLSSALGPSFIPETSKFLAE